MLKRNLPIALLTCLIMTLAAHSPALAQLKVVASIKPVHSLVSSVMQRIGSPDLIVDGSASPHSYSLKPSQAQQLQQANVVFWVGHELETFLEKPLESISSSATTVSLIDANGVVTLKSREADAHDHDHSHSHGDVDGHIWLDPRNAKAMVSAIEQTLSKADPENAEKYAANAAATLEKLDQLESDIQNTLAPARDKGFVVFHDAYQYFEGRFNVPSAGAITLTTDVAPGADRVRKIRAKITSLGAACVFTEPQFEPKLVQVIMEGLSARTGVLDPLGASGEAGPDQYFTLMKDMASSMKDCLLQLN